MELAENTFYEVKLNKAMKLAEYDIVKSLDLSVKMTWGKKSQVPSNVDELHTKLVKRCWAWRKWIVLRKL